MGLIDRKGNEIIECIYNEITGLPNKEHYLVKRGNYSGLIKTDGSQLLFPKFDKIIPLENGDYRVQKRGKWGIYDSNGINIIPDIYDELYYDKQNKQYVGMTTGKKSTEPIAKYL
ncbi:WG repeat-containing protein [Mangrovivirga cuniculi]|uniref:WG repeat-containing protein n=1 Tax=Mangrovivirga cuniculi TaxID=2715131 RepID=A0A4D7JU36_9BACT|nr:WG repeat-containing protein [Mangrovivirga cuniculi]QCK17130.1 hypothetical protein DCC35_17870 [Mangrovivirga cuniculi]